MYNFKNIFANSSNTHKRCKHAPSVPPYAKRTTSEPTLFSGGSAFFESDALIDGIAALTCRLGDSFTAKNEENECINNGRDSALL